MDDPSEVDPEDNDESQSWAPEPPEDEEGDPRADIGYETAPTRWPAARGATNETAAAPAPERPRPPPCAECGQEYPIRSFGECPFCQGRRNLRKQDSLADVIRSLKAGPSHPEEERQLVKQLYELDHPDADGLLKSLRAQREAPTRKPRRAT